MPITPKQFFIVPDPKIKTSSVVKNTTYPKEGGRFIGTGLSNNNNKGFLQVFGTGDPTDNLDVDIKIVSGGNVNSSTYIYKDDVTGSTDNDWFGEDDIRCIKDVHSPFSDQTRKAIGATAFVAPLSNREVVCIGSNQARNKLRLAYRSISSANARFGGGGWTEIDIDLNTTHERGVDFTGYSASTGCNIDATVMDDGLVVIAVKYQSDIDIYTTKDGITWSIRTKSIVSTYLGEDPFPNTSDLPTTYGRVGNIFNIKIASSGEYIRIVYVGSNSSNNAFFVKVISSTDRGSSWSLIEDNIQIDAGQQVGNNRFNLDLVGLKNGQFMLSVPDQHYMLFRFYRAQGVGSFGYITSLFIYWSFSTGPNRSPRGYFCISDEWLWFLVDGDLYTASRAITNPTHTDVNQEMNVFYMPLFDNISEGSVWYNLGQKKEILSSGTSVRHNDGITGFRGLGRYNLARGKLYNRGDSICFFGGLYDNQYFSSESLIGSVYFRFGGWNKSPLNATTTMDAKQNTSEYNFSIRKNPVNAHINYGRFFNYIEWYSCFGGLAGPLYTSETSGWTFVRSEATQSLDINRMRITGYSTSSSLYFRYLDKTYYNNETQSIEVSPLYNLAFMPRLVGQYKWQGSSYGYPLGDRNGSCITWTCRVVSGGETGGSASRTRPTGAGIRIISYVSQAASNKNEDETICLFINMKKDTNDTIEIYDVNAQSVLTTVTSLTFTGFMEFRFGLRPKRTSFGTPVISGNTVEAILCYRIEGNSSWASTSVLEVNTTPNLDFLIGSELRQEIAFGLFDQTSSGATCQVMWKDFRVHTGSSLGVFNTAFNSSLLPNILRGKRTSSLSHYIDEGVSVIWGGSGGAENDAFDLTVEHSYNSLNSIKYDSPRIRWSSGTATNINIVDLETTGGAGKEGFFHNALAVFGTNAKSIDVKYGYNGSTFANTQTLSLFRAKGRITDSSENGVKVSWDSPAPVTAIFSSSVSNRKYFAHFSNVQNSAVVDPTSYLIDRHYKDNSSNHWLEMAGVTMSFADSSLVGTTIEVYADRGWIVYSPVYGENKIRFQVNGSSWNPYEKNNTKQELYLGSVIVGTTLDLHPLEMSWDYSDTEAANTTLNSTRSGLTWGYREGPSVRTITGSFQGDVSKQVRRYIRETMRAATNFNETGFVFVGYNVVPSTDPQSDDYFLQGRFQEQLAFENVGWYYDENTQKWNPVGNISLTITEIV